MRRGRIATEDGEVVVGDCRRTTWLHERMLGLLGTRRLPPGEGLLIAPCAAVHTIGMRYPLDLVFIGRGGAVVRVCRDVRPGRLGVGDVRARMTLEVSAGWLPAGGFAGKRLVFEELRPR